MDEKMIIFKNVTKTYGDVCALHELSFDIPANKIVGLIGANGAGKTTILKHIIKYLHPDCGSIMLGGSDINSLRDEMFPVSFVPDKPVYYEELTVSEHLQFISTMYGTKDRVNNLISVLELKPHLGKVPGALSKGTLQKLMIACALLRKYELLIADEPFSGLDPKQILVLKELLRQEKEAGKTVVISTHLLSTIENLCDYYIFIDNGELLSQGTLEELTAKDKDMSLEEIYMILSRDADSQEENENVYVSL